MDEISDLRLLLRALPELVALADTGGITAAAAALDVQQPTFSRTMARLAGELDLPLLTRSGRGVELTPAARAMLPHARRALEEARSALDVARDRAAVEDRTVSVAFQTGLGQWLVPGILRDLQVQVQDVRYELRHGSRQHCVELLDEGWADVVLVSPPPANPAWETVVLLSEPLVLAVPERHRLARRAAASVREIADDPLITMRPEYGLRTLTDRLFAVASVEPSIAFESDDLETVRGLVGAGLGIAILPPAAHPLTDVVEIPLRDARAHREVAASWATTRPATTAARALQVLLRARAMI